MSAITNAPCGQLPRDADDRPIRLWLFRVARNLLTDADPAARSRPMAVQVQLHYALRQQLQEDEIAC